VLDSHTLGSTYLGDDEYGHPMFDTKRSDERLRLLEGAHTVKASVVRGQKVLLFDDLYRSGATMNAIPRCSMMRERLPTCML